MAHSDMAHAKIGGDAQDAVHGRFHLLLTRPTGWGLVEPQIIANLLGQSSLDGFMRGVSKVVQAGIQVAILPLLIMLSHQGAGNASSVGWTSKAHMNLHASLMGRQNVDDAATDLSNK